jgi:hypothetical protein
LVSVGAVVVVPGLGVVVDVVVDGDVVDGDVVDGDVVDGDVVDGVVVDGDVVLGVVVDGDVVVDFVVDVVVDLVEVDLLTLDIGVLEVLGLDAAAVLLTPATIKKAPAATALRESDGMRRWRRLLYPDLIAAEPRACLLLPLEPAPSLHELLLDLPEVNRWDGCSASWRLRRLTVYANRPHLPSHFFRCLRPGA